ncbi:MAG: HNH endonuclease [Deltaproteobacteria bacterium]|nr:HNH endonuclease [Deltaproteobacteria bacterium]
MAIRFPKADVASTLVKLPIKTQASLLVSTSPSTAAATTTPTKTTTTLLPSNISSSAATPSLAPVAATPQTRSLLTPLSASSFKLQVTLSTKGRDKLLRVKALLRHKLPKAELGDVIELALERLCLQLEAKKFAKPKHTVTKQLVNKNASSAKRYDQHGPAHVENNTNKKCHKQNSRYLPKQLRRQVAERDQYRCTYMAKDGQRCSETAGLEYHHVLPYAQGGQVSVNNIQLRCRQHNLHQAVIDFGAAKVREAIDKSKKRCRTT